MCQSMPAKEIELGRLLMLSFAVSVALWATSPASADGPIKSGRYLCVTQSTVGFLMRPEDGGTTEGKLATWPDQFEMQISVRDGWSMTVITRPDIAGSFRSNPDTVQLSSGRLPLALVRDNNMGFLLLVASNSQSGFGFRMAFAGFYGTQIKNSAIEPIGTGEFALRGICDRPQ